MVFFFLVIYVSCSMNINGWEAMVFIGINAAVRYNK